MRNELVDAEKFEQKIRQTFPIFKTLFVNKKPAQLQTSKQKCMHNTWLVKKSARETVVNELIFS